MRRPRSLFTGTCGACLAIALAASGAATSANAVPSSVQTASSGIAMAPMADASPGLPIPVDAGNGLTATVTPSSGNVVLRSAAGLAWDSSIPGIDRNGLGRGMTWDAAFVDTAGGVVVYLPGAGVFERNPTTGVLDGYTGNDRFVSHVDAPGTLPARGEVPEQQYFFTLWHHDTGVTDYFDVNGDLIAAITPPGERSDRLYDLSQPHRVMRFIDASGAVRNVTYEPGAIWVDTAAGVPTGLVVQGGQVAQVITADGGLSSFTRAAGTAAQIAAVRSTNPAGDVNVGFTWSVTHPKVVTQVTRNGEVVYAGG